MNNVGMNARSVQSAIGTSILQYEALTRFAGNEEWERMLTFHHFSA
jgi:hypothetical protein